MNERIPALPHVPAKRSRRSKLLGIVLALFLILLVVLFFRSSLSRVTNIAINGNVHLTREQVESVLGVKPGDSFFSPGTGKLEGRIKQLQAVEKASVSKSFPGKLSVTIQEYPEIGIELDAKGQTSVVLGNGLALALASGKPIPNKPVLTGWTTGDPQRAALCQVLSGITESELTDLSEIAPYPSAAYADRIRLFTRSGFEVITTIGKLKDKMTILNELVENREPGLVVMLDSDTYQRYSAQSASVSTEEDSQHKNKDSTR